MYKFSAPTSPALSARTVNSINASTRAAEPIADPILVLSRSDIRSSIEAYEQLLSSAKVYRNQMITLAQASAGFGQALERIARCKGALEAVGPSLQAAAGLHYLMSNHQQVLSDTFYKKFEIPLLENLDVHKASIAASEESYEKAMAEMSQKIKETEAENLRSGRKGQRDLAQFRKALQDLTRQVEDLDRLKTDYYQATLETEQNNLEFILSKVATVIRAEVDIFERISSKGLADPILETMITQGPDPFCAYPTADESSEIFSVLPPVPIINPAPEIPSMGTSPMNDLINENFGNYTFLGTSFQPQLQTRAEEKQDRDDDSSINTKTQRNIRPNDEISQDKDHDTEYTAPLKFRNIPTTATQQLPLSVGSDIPSIHRHFDHSANQGFHIAVDAEILHNKEFTYEEDEH